MSLSVIQRILVGFGGLLILLLVIAGAGFTGLDKVGEGLNKATGSVARINKTSNEINESIAKADTIALQFLLSRSSNSLSQLKKSFEESKKHINTLALKILQQAKEYPSLIPLLKESEEQGKRFYQYTDSAFKNHERMLALEAQIPDKKFDLKDDISYLVDNLDMLKKDHKGTQKGFASAYLKDQFESLQASINDYFDSTKLKDMETLKTSMSKTLSSMTNNLNYLNDPDTNDTVKQIQKEVLGKNSVIENYHEYILLDQESEVFANKLVDNMDIISALSKKTIAKTEALREEAKREAQEAARLSRLVMGIVVLISVLIAIVITLWVSRSIRKPLAHVMQVLGKIADGDFTQRSDVTSKDEFGELSRWVNQLVVKLQSVMKDIDDAANNVSVSAEKNVRLASETKGLMNAQSEKTSMIATAMTQMTSTVNEVAKNAEVTLSQVQEADSLAGESHDKMNANVQQIEQLVSQLEASAGVVNELNDHSQNIGKILEVIQDIAEQTNLLALNAAIEAARAGEQGRGFAVVADEVRSLATRTHASTEEIQRVIDLLQGGVSKTVSAMKDSQDKAYASVEDTRVVGDALNSLQTRMVTIRDLSTQIATAAEEQSLVAQDINGSIQEISEMSAEATQSADLSEKDSELLFDLSSNQKALLAQFKIVP